MSQADHHANIVPWQIIAEEYGIIIDWVQVHPDGTINYDDLASRIQGAKVIALTGASNVTGEVLDLEKMKEIFMHHERPLFILDGSQRFPHMSTDVEKYGIDIFVATGHKIMSDTGIGFFYASRALLREMVPAFCGG